jgi:hypothetical protein
VLLSRIQQAITISIVRPPKKGLLEGTKIMEVYMFELIAMYVVVTCLGVVC